MKPPFTLFQQFMLWLMRVSPIQLNINAWLMLVAFEYLCSHFRLFLHSFSFFYFFNYSLRGYRGHIYFTQGVGIHHPFTKVPTSQKGWKDTFNKVVRRLEKKRPCWITSSRKLVLLIKQFTMENDFKKGLNMLYEEDQTIMDTTMDMSQES